MVVNKGEREEGSEKREGRGGDREREKGGEMEREIE